VISTVHSSDDPKSFESWQNAETPLPQGFHESYAQNWNVTFDRLLYCEVGTQCKLFQMGPRKLTYCSARSGECSGFPIAQFQQNVFVPHDLLELNQVEKHCKQSLSEYPTEIALAASTSEVIGRPAPITFDLLTSCAQDLFTLGNTSILFVLYV
jgi:hypothetical protein